MPTYLVTLWFEDSRTFPMDAENEEEAYQKACDGEWTDAEFEHPEAEVGGEGFSVGEISRGDEVWYPEDLKARLYQD